MKLFKPFKDKTTKERRWNRQICSPSALFSIAFSLISDFPFERVARKTGKDAGNSYSHNKTGCWLNRRKWYPTCVFSSIGKSCIYCYVLRSKVKEVASTAFTFKIDING